MVTGIEKFEQAFADFAGNYVIIGGVASAYHESEAEQEPRKTKDIDMVLIVEALTDAFVERFWAFVKEAGYMHRNVGSGDRTRKHQYYRFKAPVTPGFPYQIELFSRKIDCIKVPDDAHLTPIPVEADLSSLSAILMSDDYYDFTISHSINVEGVHIASQGSLIALKCKAYIEMVRVKEAGENVDSKDIKKHRNDVFRLLATIPASIRFRAPQSIIEDIKQFCHLVKDDLPPLQMFKEARIRRPNPLAMLDTLSKIFTDYE
ncbi:MAG: hypothetical protein ACI4AM_10280 [Muribaculaceae bacterium]